MVLHKEVVAPEAIAANPEKDWTLLNLGNPDVFLHKHYGEVFATRQQQQRQHTSLLAEDLKHESVGH